MSFNFLNIFFFFRFTLFIDVYRYPHTVPQSIAATSINRAVVVCSSCEQLGPVVQKRVNAANPGLNMANLG